MGQIKRNHNPCGIRLECGSNAFHEYELKCDWAFNGLVFIKIWTLFWPNPDTPCREIFWPVLKKYAARASIEYSGWECKPQKIKTLISMATLPIASLAVYNHYLLQVTF